MDKRMKLGDMQLFQGTHGKYYVWNHIPYDIHFPLEWAMNPKKTVVTTKKEEGIDSSIIHGPENCANCMEFGIWRGVFIGYCVHCCQNMYNAERGNGMIECGLEFEFGVPLYDRKSMWNTYLKGVSLDQIGDRKLDHFVTESSRNNDYGYWLTLNQEWDQKNREWDREFLKWKKRYQKYKTLDNDYFTPYFRESGYEITGTVYGWEDRLEGERWFDCF